jgi:hypothetical protein
VALYWTLWNVRNKLTIERKFSTHPAESLYKMPSYLQVWGPVARRHDKEELELVIERIRPLHSLIQD